MIFTLLSALIVLYFIMRIIVGLDKPFPIGEALVTIEWPSPVFAKPITYLTFFILLAWLFGLESLRDRFLRVSDHWLRIMMIIATIFAFTSGYEALWNFAMWSAMVASKPTGNPDEMANIYPNPQYPVNFVFATKIFVMLLFASLYFIIFLLTIIWRREKSV